MYQIVLLLRILNCFFSSIEVITEFEEEVFCTRKFNLAAIINHSGKLNIGYYTCVVKDGETWWHCNDKAVVPVNMDDMKINHCLMFFFIRLHIFL